MKWKAEVQVTNDQKWYENGIVFTDKKDAQNYARALFARWTQTTAWRVVKA